MEMAEVATAIIAPIGCAGKAERCPKTDTPKHD
jgi:hypothetical protein